MRSWACWRLGWGFQKYGCLWVGLSTAGQGLGSAREEVNAGRGCSSAEPAHAAPGGCMHRAWPSRARAQPRLDEVTPGLDSTLSFTIKGGDAGPGRCPCVPPAGGRRATGMLARTTHHGWGINPGISGIPQSSHFRGQWGDGHRAAPCHSSPGQAEQQRPCPWPDSKREGIIPAVGQAVSVNPSQSRGLPHAGVSGGTCPQRAINHP